MNHTSGWSCQGIKVEVKYNKRSNTILPCVSLNLLIKSDHALFVMILNILYILSLPIATVFFLFDEKCKYANF